MVAARDAILVDTHYILWQRIKPAQLSREEQGAIDDATVRYISIVSIWEIALLQGLGQLPADPLLLDVPPGFDLLRLQLRHCKAYGALPLLHRDPFDRMLIAQAESEHVPLLTRDQTMRAYHGHATFLP